MSQQVEVYRFKEQGLNTMTMSPLPATAQDLNQVSLKLDVALVNWIAAVWIGLYIAQSLVMVRLILFV